VTTTSYPACSRPGRPELPGDSLRGWAGRTNGVTGVGHGETTITTKSLPCFDAGALEYSVCM
jgi:hypothetical protein